MIVIYGDVIVIDRQCLLVCLLVCDGDSNGDSNGDVLVIAVVCLVSNVMVQ
jgi:hypothetical protein